MILKSLKYIIVLETKMINSLVVRFLTSLLLFFVFLFLYKSSKEKYLIAWSIAWFSYAINYLFDYYFFESPLYLNLLGPINAMIIITLIIVGACLFVKIKLSRYYYILAIIHIFSLCIICF